MLTIGLTGGIGSGKSTVAKMLAELGAPVLDADKIGHLTYAPGASAYDAVIAAFGREIVAPDRTIDRRKLGSIVFGQPAQLKKLTSIVWPALFAKMREMVAEMRSAGEKRPIVIEAAVLVEANWMALFDEIWLVTASTELVVQRVERERGLKPAETEARIRAQLSDDERKRHAKLIIRNDGTLEALRSDVEKAWKGAVKRNG